ETGADGVAFRAALDERLDAGAWHDGEGLRLAPDAIKLFKLALARAHRHRRPKIEPVDLFVALAFDAHGALCEIMSGLGVGQGTRVKAVVELESAFEVARAFADAGANLSGKQVRIRSGPFANFTGYINDVRNDEKKLEVGVSIFGARRFIELNYRDIEILDFARPQ
ncbi:MAG TPA: hypothetical protein VJT82_03640, partial [Pyrinomonadaceae bacterium]|nr:hypothetical protein [Pyrinomonadaceae bacterium]